MMRSMTSGSMLPPDRIATVVPLSLHLAGEDRRDPDRTRGLDDHLGALQQHEQRARDVVLLDRDDLVDDIPDDFEVEEARLTDRDSVGDGGRDLASRSARPR